MAVTALPPRAREVLDRVQAGADPSDIAVELGVTRNAIYQQIGKLRREGYLPERQASAESISVDDTIERTRRSMEEMVERLDARGAALEQELDDLREQRRRMVEVLNSLPSSSS